MDMPRGLCLTHDACVRLGIPAKLTRQRWVSAMDIPGLPEVPAEVIHRMLEVIDWTGLPFVSLAASDLYGLALSRPQTPFKHENAMFKFLGEASPSKLWIAQPCERR